MDTEQHDETCREPELGSLLGSYELGLLSREERGRFEEHLLACDHCFAEFDAMEPVSRRLVGRESVAAESTPGSDPVAARQVRRRTVLLVGAAAASIAIVMLLGVLAPWGAGDDEMPERIPRGPADGPFITAIAPVGEVATVSELTWLVVTEIERYEVRIHDERGRRVWDATVEGAPFELPDEARQALRPGRTFYWQVEGLGTDGRRWSSGLQSFSLTGP